MLEFDLRVTNDDWLVVAHDAEVRPAHKAIRIADSSVTELRVPTAKCVVDAARTAGLGLYADFKTATRTAIARFVELLDDQKMTDQVIFASAAPPVVRMLAEVAPTLPRSVLFRSTSIDPVALADTTSADFVHPCWEHLLLPHELLGDNGWIDRIRAEQLGVVTWHEERESVLAALYGLPVDGVCTDDPALLTRVAANSAATAALLN